MIAKYTLTPAAQSDLRSIYYYTIQNWGMAQSEVYLAKLQQTIQLLAETPSLGKPRNELDTDAFSFPHASHVIYYLLHKQQIVIFAVLHKSMVPEKHLLDRV